MRITIAALLVVSACSQTTEDKPAPLVVHDNADTTPPSEPLVSTPEPYRPPGPRAVNGVAPLWDNAPPNARMLGNGRAPGLGAGPGFVYACSYDRLRASPKTGGASLDRGPCHGAFRPIADGTTVYFCDQTGLWRVDAQSDRPRQLVDIADSCLDGAVDDTHVYYVIPSFEGIADSGLYRIDKDGGKPELVKATRKGEQVVVTVDECSVWIGNVFGGTIAKLDKQKLGAPQVVISGQKGIVQLGVTATDVIWYSENTQAIRKRAKTGGAITTLATGVTHEPVIEPNGDLAWFTWDSPQTDENLNPTGTVYEQRAGAKTPTVLYRGARSVDLAADADGVYISQHDEMGVLMIPR